MLPTSSAISTSTAHSLSFLSHHAVSYPVGAVHLCFPRTEAPLCNGRCPQYLLFPPYFTFMLDACNTPLRIFREPHRVIHLDDYILRCFSDLSTIHQDRHLFLELSEAPASTSILGLFSTSPRARFLRKTFTQSSPSYNRSKPKPHLSYREAKMISPEPSVLFSRATHFLDFSLIALERARFACAFILPQGASLQMELAIARGMVRHAGSILSSWESERAGAYPLIQEPRGVCQTF